MTQQLLLAAKDILTGETEVTGTVGQMCPSEQAAAGKPKGQLISVK